MRDAATGPTPKRETLAGTPAETVPVHTVAPEASTMVAVPEADGVNETEASYADEREATMSESTAGSMMTRLPSETR